VRDVDRFLKEHAGEVKVVLGPNDEGRDQLAYITGPDGEWIELMSPRRKRGRKA